MEVAFGSKVGDRESEDGQLVQLGEHRLIVGKKGGKHVEFRIQSLTMSLGWIGLCLSLTWMDADTLAVSTTSLCRVHRSQVIHDDDCRLLLQPPRLHVAIESLRCLAAFDVASHSGNFILTFIRRRRAKNLTCLPASKRERGRREEGELRCRPPLEHTDRGMPCDWIAACSAGGALDAGCRCCSAAAPLFSLLHERERKKIAERRRSRELGKRGTRRRREPQKKERERDIRVAGECCAQRVSEKKEQSGGGIGF